MGDGISQVRMQSLDAEEADLLRQLEETTYFSDGIVDLLFGTILVGKHVHNISPHCDVKDCSNSI